MQFQEDLHLLAGKWHLGSVLSTVLFTTSLQAELSITPSSFLVPSSIARSPSPAASCHAAPFFQPTFLPMFFCSRQSNWLSPILVANCSVSTEFPVTSAPAHNGIPRVRLAKIEKKLTNTKKFTINSAIQYALRHNPEILDSIQQIRSVHGKLISTRAQLLPRLGATSACQDIPSSLASSVFSETSRVADGSTIKLPGTQGRADHLSWNARLAVQQLIFDGGRSLAGMRAAKHQEYMSFFTLCSTIDNIIAQVKTAFFRVILNRTLVAIQEQSVVLLEDQLENQKKRYQVGVVQRLSVLQAQSAVATATSALAKIQNDSRTAQDQLVRLLGINYTKRAEIPFHVVGNLEVRCHTISPEESVRTGLTRSPTLKAQREHVLAQAASFREALSKRYPKITLGVGYLVQTNASAYLRKIMGGWFCGLNGTWNFLDGSEIVQSKAQLEQSIIRYDSNVRSVVASIQRNVADLQQAQETIGSQQTNVAEATETLRLACEQFDSGIGTQLEVFDAKIKLLQSQAAVLQARFCYIQALAQYASILSINTQHIELEDLLTKKEQRRFEKLKVLDANPLTAYKAA